MDNMNIRKAKEIKDPINCPNCGITLLYRADLSKDERKLPSPGDLSICRDCAELCEFGNENNLVKMSEEKMAEMKARPEVQKVISLFKSEKDLQMKNSGYSNQLDAMSDAVVDWRVNHQDSNPMIQYNFQKGVGVIAALQDAIDNNFVSVNDDALQMFKELGWLDDGPAMPTVLMVRVVLEHVFGKE